MIAGIKIEKNTHKGNEYALCRVESFTPEFKDKIRQELSAITAGAVQVGDNPDFHNYQITLKRFLYVYQSKTESTKKGIVGELLAHILIPEIFNNTESLSVLSNKEENNIKKGFDIIYCDFSKLILWYSEVKSGYKISGDDSEQTNRKLINSACADLKDKFIQHEDDKLWNSAIIDVKLTQKEAKYMTAKQLLTNDSPLMLNSPSTSTDKNAFLISVLYENPSNPCTISSLEVILDNLIAKGDFNNLIIFSIQQKAHDEIVQFLKSEEVSHA